jgi:hypothetical protein
MSTDVCFSQLLIAFVTCQVILVVGGADLYGRGTFHANVITVDPVVFRREKGGRGATMESNAVKSATFVACCFVTVTF